MDELVQEAGGIYRREDVMDDTERFNELYNRFSKMFGFKLYTHSGWNEENIRVTYHDNVILSFSAKPDPEDEDDNARQRVHRLAYSSLHSWIMLKLKELNLDIKI